MLVSTNPEYRAIHRVLHILWTKSVGTKKYVKSEWMQLDELIHRMMRNPRSVMSRR